MSPPPAAGHVAHSPQIALGRQRSLLARSALIRLLDRRTLARVRNLTDVVVLYLAACAALFASAAVRAVPGNGWRAVAFPLVVIAIMHARRNPHDRLNGSLLDSSSNVVGAVSLAAMLLIAFDSIVGAGHPAGLALRLWLFGVVYLGAAQAVLLWLRQQAVSVEALATPTLIVGAGIVGEHLVTRLTAEPRYGLRPVGFLDSDPLRSDSDRRLGTTVRHSSFVPVLGGPDDLGDAIEQTGARRVILAFSSEPDHTLVSKVRLCQERGVEVSLVPRLYELLNERATLDHVGGLPLVSLRLTDPRGWEFVLKHAIDRGFAALALVVLSPLLLAVALAIKLTSPGPVMFRQRRVGRDGQVFDLLKFRTMREATHPEEFVPPAGCAPGGVEGEDRRTAVGRFLRETSVDELPQLINVVRGEMSLVGPRPERPEFVRRFAVEVARYDDRHRVKSGITGWAQVNGLRGQTSIADRVEWDNYYILNWSLRFDLKIIALTIAEVVRFRG